MENFIYCAVEDFEIRFFAGINSLKFECYSIIKVQQFDDRVFFDFLFCVKVH